MLAPGADAAVLAIDATPFTSAGWAGSAEARRSLGVWFWALNLSSVTAPGRYELEANVTRSGAVVATPPSRSPPRE